MRTRPATRRAGTVVAAAALLALTGAGTASAQSFVDPLDPCLGDPPAAPFSDRGQLSDEQKRFVDCLAAEGITEGKSGGVFDPTGTVTRGQMASFLVRTLEAGGYELPAPSDPGFTDIGGNTHEDAINVLAAIEVTTGVTQTTFRPNDVVKRDQMASFVVRAAEYAYEGDELDGSTTGALPFTDVQEGNVHRANIAAAAELIGVSQGTSPTSYNPGGSTSRAQMAVFVIRLLDVTLVPEP